MIYSAIAALKEKDGSSKRAIAKYIERVYSDLPPTHSTLLTHHLQRLKTTGRIVMVKKSYKLPNSSASASGTAAAVAPRSDMPNNTSTHQQVLPATAAAAASSSGPKRGRGRPPKPKPDFQLPSQPNDMPNVESGSQPVLAALGLVQDADPAKGSPVPPPKTLSVEGGSAKRRGRPPKSGSGKPRKPKSVAQASLVGSAGLKRGRGRPRVQHMGSPFRPRGRPRKVGAEAIGLAGGVMPGKRRGRPPKIGGVISRPMKPKRGIGRPVGRPRKDVSWASDAGAAYGELKRKLEFFQSRVMQAVSVLKPQLSSENYGVVAAIQELEGLAAMDINIPMEEVPPQQPQPLAHAQAQAQPQLQPQLEQELYLQQAQGVHN